MPWRPARWQFALINAVIVVAILSFAWWSYRSSQPEQDTTESDKAAKLAAQEKARAEKERDDVARLTAMLDGPATSQLVAVGRLAKYGPKARPAVPALIRLMKDDKADVGARNSAIYALGEIGPGAEEAVEPLIEQLEKGDDWATRSLAARALGAIRSKAALGALRGAMEDEREHTEVRSSARGAVGTIEGK